MSGYAKLAAHKYINISCLKGREKNTPYAPQSIAQKMLVHIIKHGQIWTEKCNVLTKIDIFTVYPTYCQCLILILFHFKSSNNQFSLKHHRPLYGHDTMTNGFIYFDSFQQTHYSKLFCGGDVLWCGHVCSGFIHKRS